MIEFLYAIILGIVEGVTEFVPVSSTGHLLLVVRWMGLDLESGFWKMFSVFIQLGAILAVVVYFRDRLRVLLKHPISPEKLEQDEEAEAKADPDVLPPHSSDETSGSAAESETEPAPVTTAVAVRPARRQLTPVELVLVGTFPVLLIGFLINDWVEATMGENPLIIAAALGIGGVAMWLIEAFRRTPRTESIEVMTLWQALGIGLIQILAVVFPGTSRSAATIMGGLLLGLSRAAAAEFSFFLAIPAMFAACGYSLLKQLTSTSGMTGREVLLLATGTVVSFVVAWIVIAAFMNFIRKHSFVPFAIYRIVLAVIVFLLAR